MALEQFANKASTTLASSAASGDSTITVSSPSGFPTKPNFRLLIESEILLVTAIAGSTFTVTRGKEGTTAASHVAGKLVDHILTAESLKQMQSDSIDHAICNGRLTLSSDATFPISTSDITGASTLYFTPYKGNKICLYDGTYWLPYKFSQIMSTVAFGTIVTTGTTTNASAVVTAIPSTTGMDIGMPITGGGIVAGSKIKSVDTSSQVTLTANANGTASGATITVTKANHDIFIYDNSGTLTLEYVAWLNNTTRSTNLSVQDGVYVKSGDATRRYLGTIRASTSTTTEDSKQNRSVWNCYNRIKRPMFVVDPAINWTYSTLSTWRIANNNANNYIQFVAGLTEDPIMCDVICNIVGNNDSACVGIGFDTNPSGSLSNIIRSGDSYNSGAAQNMGMTHAHFEDTMTIGWHRIYWLEFARVGSPIFQGTNSADWLSGIIGSVWG